MCPTSRASQCEKKGKPAATSPLLQNKDIYVTINACHSAGARIAAVCLSAAWILPAAADEPCASLACFTLREGHSQIISVGDDFQGYFIPQFGGTYTLPDGTDVTYELPDGWDLPEEDDNRYHDPGGGAPGVDIFGWVDGSGDIHLFDHEDSVSAWRDATTSLVDAGNNQVQVDHGGGQIDLFEHIDPTITDGTPIAAGDTLGTLQDLGPFDTHLHFSVTDENGEYVNPLIYFDRVNCIPAPGAALLAVVGLSMVPWLGRRLV